MWTRLREIANVRGGSIPANHYVHSDGRELRFDEDWKGDKVWMMISPISQNEAADLLSDEFGEEGPVRTGDVDDSIVL